MFFDVDLPLILSVQGHNLGLETFRAIYSRLIFQEMLLGVSSILLLRQPFTA